MRAQEINEKRVISAWRSGVPKREIARTFGCDEGKIRRIIFDHERRTSSEKARLFPSKLSASGDEII